MSALDKAVTKAKRDDGTDGWDFQCPGVQGSPCGDPAARPFHSDGWPTKAAATARGAEHFADHKLGAEILAAVAAAVGATDDPEDIDRAAIAAAVMKDSEHSPMSTLEEFRAKHKLGVNDNGHAVSLEDL